MAPGFFIGMVLAAIFAFGGIAPGTAGTAKIIFFVLLFLFVGSLVVGRDLRKRGLIE